MPSSQINFYYDVILPDAKFVGQLSGDVHIYLMENSYYLIYFGGLGIDRIVRLEGEKMVEV